MSLTYFFVKTFFRLLSIAMQWPILLSTKPATSGSSIIGKFVAKMDSTTRYSTWHELIMINKSGVVWKILWVSPWDSKVSKSSVSLNPIYHIVWKSQKSLIFECLKLAVKQNYQTGQFKSNENWWKIEENRIRYFGWFSNNVYQKLLFLWNFFYCRWSHIPLSSSHYVRRSIGDHHPILHCRQQSSASILLDQRFVFGGTNDFFFTSIHLTFFP